MMGQNAEGAGPFVWSRVMDGGCWAYSCDVFEAMQVLLQGPKTLTWLQTEPRCGPLDLAPLRTLEVASGHLASCVHLPGASDGHSWGLLQRQPYPSAPCPSVAPWSFSWRQRQVALLKDVGVQPESPW